MTAKRLPQGVRRLPRPGDPKGPDGKYIPSKMTGRYQARYPVQRVVNGEVRTVQVSAGTFASARDAADARSLQIALLRNGGWVDPLGPKTTVLAWSLEWQKLRRGGNTKTQSFLRSRILPWWGERKLGDITPLDVQTWINLLVDDGLSPATISGLYATFKMMMQHAVDHDLLVKTPCRNITLPTLRRSEPVKLSVAQLRELEAAAPPRYAAMIHLSAWCGLRWQEAAALRWEHVVFGAEGEAGLLRIREAVKVAGGVGSTKSGKERLVPFGQATAEVLRAHRRDFGASELLFPSTRGTVLDGGNFRKGVWAKMVEDWSPRPTYHDLRHSHAAHMTRLGMDSVVLSDRLGHHKPSFTADRYGWRRDDYAAVSAALVEEAMRGE